MPNSSKPSETARIALWCYFQIREKQCSSFVRAGRSTGGGGGYAGFLCLHLERLEMVSGEEADGLGNE